MTHIKWETFLPADVSAKSNQEDRYLALFSLLDYLEIPLTGFLIWLFSSKHGAVREKVGKFLSYHANYAIPFAPKVVWDLWHQSSHVVHHLHHEIVIPCAHEITVAESDALLADSSLRISVSRCTLKSLEDALNPFGLVRKFRELSPFMFGILMTSMAAPNKYQKRKASRLAKNLGISVQPQGQTLDECDDDKCDEDPDVPEFTQTFVDFAQWEQEFTYFNVKCLVPIVFIISILLFNRNSYANVLALPLGIFLRIGGANKRMISVLNSIGLCVSYWTVERLKQALTDDAIVLAQNLMCSTKSWFVVFDNINVYLRKFEQRLTNKNSMLSLTNVAIIAQPDFPPDALELEPFLKMRGNRSNGTAADIKITCEESQHMEQAMTAIVAGLLVAYCPGSTKWPEYGQMKAKVAALTPTDRPLPVKKTETRPFGVFDINEGSKRGCVQVIHAIAKRSTLTMETWVQYVRILMGDWLSAANVRGARRERADDISPFEQLINIKEISALWHYALNALHMIIKTHLGNASDDPGSLASHKGLLGRVWDVTAVRELLDVLRMVGQ